MSQNQTIAKLSADVIRTAAAKNLKIATAESCTGGLVSAALTDHAGSSAVLEYGFVVYANAAKTSVLGVDENLIAGFGAVSGEVARAMAVGALHRSGADLAVAVTGIAGPGGGSAQKPVGTVWFGLASKSSGTRIERRLFPKGSRRFVRGAAVETALRLVLVGVTNY